MILSAGFQLSSAATQPWIRAKHQNAPVEPDWWAVNQKGVTAGSPGDAQNALIPNRRLRHYFDGPSQSFTQLGGQGPLGAEYTGRPAYERNPPSLSSSPLWRRVPPTYGRGDPRPMTGRQP